MPAIVRARARPHECGRGRHECLRYGFTGSHTELGCSPDRNTDTDDHTVVSNDFFNTAGNSGVNVLIAGTDNNGGKPGTLTLHFNKPGLWTYYCRFHAHLDGDHQPVAPGPDGGIQDPNGNFGTPMNGVITVLPGED